MLLVRTGYCKRRREVGPSNPTTDGTPGNYSEIVYLTGPHPDIMPWLKQKDVALLGSDTSNDVQPPLCPGMRTPVHILGLVSMGLLLLDNADLEQLSEECATRNRWEFMLSILPLQLSGCTGSPVNPVALL